MENLQLNFLNKCPLFVLIISIIVISTSLTVLIGAVYNIPVLTSLSPSWVSMKGNTAICFLLSGLALLFLRNKNLGFINYTIVATITSIIMLISIMTIFECVSGVDLGIDQLFIKDRMLSVGALYPGRMVVITAVNFFLVACAFIYLLKKDASGWISETFGWLIFFMGLISFNNYIYGANMHYAIVVDTSMAVQSAALFVLISFGILLVKPDAGIVKILLRNSTGGYMLRRMLPVLLLVPMLLAIAENQMEKARLIEGNFGDSIISAGIFFILGIVILIVARMIDCGEVKLTAAETQILRKEMIFREFAENIDIVFFTTSPDLSNVIYISRAYEKVWGRSRESLYKHPKEWFDAVVPDDKKIVYEAFFEGMIKKGKLNANAEYRIIRPDGSIRNIFARAFQLKDQNQKVFSVIGMAVDMTDVKLEKIYKQIQYEILRIMENNKTINDIAPKTIEIICNALDWDMGEIWLLDESQNILRCVNIWHKDVTRLIDYDIKSRKHTFGFGDGLPGRIWKERQPVWIADYSSDQVFSRSDDAAKAGLNSAFGIPVIFQDKVFGIMEFFSYKIQSPDAELLVMMENLGKSMGDFIQRMHSDTQIQTISRHDLLTGLLNRSALEDDLNHLIADGKSEIIAILILDIDRFKLINEALGHDYGDILLKLAARRLDKAIDHEKITVARLGADKFIMSFPTANKKDALDYAHTIKCRFDGPFAIDQKEITVTVSIGIATYPQNGVDSKDLITNADLAMIEAKQQGGNRVQFFTNELPGIATKKLTMDTDLRHAITNNQFFLVYQPQIDFKTGDICAAEALVRWQHPIKGLINPVAFIGFAEEAGLIVALNEHILRMVFKQLSSNWSGPPVSVNISAQQFKDGFHLVEYLKSLMNEFALNSRHIELEITEGLLMEDTEHNIAVLTALHDLGFQIAIDDFGTGYSSFSYLHRLPVHKIKIDRAFITGLPGNIANAKIVRAIISMVHSLDMNVVAEGAETKAEIEFLMQEKCDIVQGFYYYKPMPFDDLNALIAKLLNC